MYVRSVITRHKHNHSRCEHNQCNTSWASNTWAIVRFTPLRIPHVSYEPLVAHPTSGGTQTRKHSTSVVQTVPSVYGLALRDYPLPPYVNNLFSKSTRKWAQKPSLLDKIFGAGHVHWYLSPFPSLLVCKYIRKLRATFHIHIHVRVPPGSLHGGHYGQYTINLGDCSAFKVIGPTRKFLGGLSG